MRRVVVFGLDECGRWAKRAERRRGCACVCVVVGGRGERLMPCRESDGRGVEQRHAAANTRSQCNTSSARDGYASAPRSESMTSRGEKCLVCSSSPPVSGGRLHECDGRTNGTSLDSTPHPLQPCQATMGLAKAGAALGDPSSSISSSWIAFLPNRRWRAHALCVLSSTAS